MDTPRNLRQYVITGVPTTGKTTFSHKLVERFALQHIGIDGIVTGFERAFPDLGIRHEAPDLAAHQRVGKLLAPFVSGMIDTLASDSFVIEGYLVPMDELVLKHSGLTYMVFGYPNTTPEEKLAHCREYDVYNWTNNMTDELLLRRFEFFIQESKRLAQVCTALNVPFFDTSDDHWGTIDEALKTIPYE